MMGSCGLKARAYRYCIICYKKTKNRTSICHDGDEPAAGVPSAVSFRNGKVVIKATKTIFQYLLIPEKNFSRIFPKIHSDIDIPFCSGCEIVVGEIIELERKMELFQIQIQRKVEGLGRLILASPVSSSNGTSSLASKKAFPEVWQFFQQPVIRNYVRGLLPNPCVKLKLEDLSQNRRGEREEEPLIKSVSQSRRKDKLSKSRNENVAANAAKKEQTPKYPVVAIDRIESGSDSEHTFYIENDPEGLSKEVDDRIKTEVPEEAPEGQNEEVDDVIKVESPEETILDYSGNESDTAEDNVCDKPDDELRPNHTEGCVELLKYLTGPTFIESTASEGNVENQEGEQNKTPDKEVTIDEIQEKRIEDIQASNERKSRPTRASAPTKFTGLLSGSDSSDSESSRSCSDFEPASDLDSEFEKDRASDEDDDNPVVQKDSSPKVLSGKNDKSRAVKVTYHKPSKSAKVKDSPAKPCKDKNKDKLVGKIEGKDYWKCTKCDFFELQSDYSCSRLKLLYKVANHYSYCHNPVKRNEISKSVDDRKCYQCTKCSHNVILYETSTRPKGIEQKDCYRKLSLHYMKVHDGLNVKQSKQASLGIEELRKLQEGIDFYHCPDSECSFYTLIRNKETNIQRGRVLARRIIMNHFSREHDKSLNIGMSKTMIEKIDDEKSCFKCPKCEFRSIVIGKEFRKARQKLNAHYKGLHIKPWESFPNLYKKTNFSHCIEEKVGTKDVIKCNYPGCIFYKEIVYLESKSREECKLLGYKAVSCHSTCHTQRKYVYVPLHKGNSNSLNSDSADKPQIQTDKALDWTPTLSSASTATSQALSNSEENCHETNAASGSTSSPSNVSVLHEGSDYVREELKVQDLSQSVEKFENNAERKPVKPVENARRSKRTTSVKRKRYDTEESASEGSQGEDFQQDPDFKQERDDNPVEEPLSTENSGKRKVPKQKKLKSNRKKSSTQKSTVPDAESILDPEADSYRCWKCDFIVTINYTSGKSKSYFQTAAKHKLVVHFNSVHNYEELCFRDPFKLLVKVDDKEFFRCPKCDYRVQIKFNPEKHTDSSNNIQGRKNARSALGRHYFHKHCAIEQFGHLSSISTSHEQADVDADADTATNNPEGSTSACLSSLPIPPELNFMEVCEEQSSSLQPSSPNQNALESQVSST